MTTVTQTVKSRDLYTSGFVTFGRCQWESCSSPKLFRNKDLLFQRFHGQAGYVWIGMYSQHKFPNFLLLKSSACSFLCV